MTPSVKGHIESAALLASLAGLGKDHSVAKQSCATDSPKSVYDDGRSADPKPASFRPPSVNQNEDQEQFKEVMHRS